jgi:hypothetical protein
MKRLVIVVFTLILIGFPALRCGATVYQSDGSAASVQGLHNAVLNGDTTTLPAGTFTWNTQVRITKNITLQGAGQGATTIYDNIPKVGGDTTILIHCSDITGSLRITGFTIHGMAGDPQDHNNGTVLIADTSHVVRVDNMSFVRPDSLAITYNGDIWGVVDHCYFDGLNFTQGVGVHHTFLNPNAIIFTGLYLRSGTGVIFNNTFSGGTGQTGYKNGMMFTVYRNHDCSGANWGQPWGNANGTNPWDGNTLPNGYPALD